MYLDVLRENFGVKNIVEQPGRTYKQLLDEVFSIYGLIKVEARDIGWGRKPSLIAYTLYREVPY